MISYALALSLFITGGAVTAQEGTVTVTPSASGNCDGTAANCGTAENRNGDRDTSWPGLQVDEGDVITFRVMFNPELSVTGFLGATIMGNISGEAANTNDLRNDLNEPITLADLRGNLSYSFSSPIRVFMAYTAFDDGIEERDKTLTLELTQVTITTLVDFIDGIVGGSGAVTVTIRGTDTAPAFGTVSPQIFYKGAYTEFQLPVSGGNGPISCTATNLPTGLTLDQDGSGSCSGLEPCKICGTLNSPQTVTITATDADCNPGTDSMGRLDCSMATSATAMADQGTLTFTINTPRHPADITDSNGLDATDALLLFQHYSGLPVTEDKATRADDWKDNGRAQGGDLNSDGPINRNDALIMYYAYEFGDLLDQSAVLRQLLLNGVRGRMPDTDAIYRELLRRANRLQ